MFPSGIWCTHDPELFTSNLLCAYTSTSEYSTYITNYYTAQTKMKSYRTTWTPWWVGRHRLPRLRIYLPIGSPRPNARRPPLRWNIPSGCNYHSIFFTRVHMLMRWDVYWNCLLGKAQGKEPFIIHERSDGKSSANREYYHLISERSASGRYVLQSSFRR